MKLMPTVDDINIIGIFLLKFVIELFLFLDLKFT
jgi:hypothetical protein